MFKKIFIIALAFCLSTNKGMADTEIFWPPFFIKNTDDISTHVTSVGPFFEHSHNQKAEWQAVRPFYYEHTQDKNERSVHFLYPLASRYENPQGWNVHFLGFLQHSASTDKYNHYNEEFMIFPFYFSRKTNTPNQSYQGLMPIGGHVKGKLGYEEIKWTLFPFYLALKKPYETRYFFPWPFIQYLKGPESTGYGLWPLFGTFERKGHYEHDFAFWPLIYSFKDDLYKKTPRLRNGFLPFYAMESSEKLKAETWIWPFFGYVDCYEPKYHETHYFWPLWVQRRGINQYINRWAPIYTHSQQLHHQKKWILWPLAKIEQWEKENLIIERSQACYVLIWHESQKSKDATTPFHAQKTHVWPFFSYRNDGHGAEEFQFLSPFEVFFPHNEVVRRLYSPLFAFWRYQKWANGDMRQSFLFNFILIEKKAETSRLAIGPLLEWEKTNDSESLKLMKGLISLEQKKAKKKLKLFWASSH